MRIHELVALSALTLVWSGPPQEVQDAIAGVWKGVARGDGRFFSSWGVPATLLLVRGADGELGGRAIFQGREVDEVQLRAEPDGGALDVSGVMAGMSVQVHLVLEGERMQGQLLGMGAAVDVELRRLGPRVLEAPPEGGAPTGLTELTDEEWARDLRFLEDYLPQVHADAYHAQSEQAWQASIEALIGRLGEFDAFARAVAVAQIVAGVGDAHTGLNWREVRGFDRVPVDLEAFSDGVFVTGVHEAAGDALGARVVRVGKATAEEAQRAVGSIMAADNASWRRAQEPGLLAVPGLLATLGITDSPERVPLTVEHAGGERFELSIGFEREGEWLTAPDPRYDPVPLWRTQTGRPYWYQLLPERGAVYLAYNSCREDPRQPMADFMGAVLAAFDAAGARRLVVDLRNNGGGSSRILTAQLERLSGHPVIGEPGGLVALIGKRTYSSATIGAFELRGDAGATLIGEPTGGRPNTYGEMLSFRLPHTRLQVFYSVKYFRALEDEDPPSIEPAVRVELASGEYLSGADPVLERALE